MTFPSCPSFFAFKECLFFKNWNFCTKKAQFVSKMYYSSRIIGIMLLKSVKILKYRTSHPNFVDRSNNFLSRTLTQLDEKFTKCNTLIVFSYKSHFFHGSQVKKGARRISYCIAWNDQLWHHKKGRQAIFSKFFNFMNFQGKHEKSRTA